MNYQSLTIAELERYADIDEKAKAELEERLDLTQAELRSRQAPDEDHQRRLDWSGR